MSKKNKLNVIIQAVTLAFVLVLAFLCIGMPKTSVSRAESSAIHSYNHSEKFRFNANGDVINQTVFTADDASTYPFLYEYRTTEGDKWGMRGSQQNQSVVMTGIKPDSWAKGCIYGDSSYTGFNKSAGIASIDGDIEPRELMLSFISPYSGNASISDFTIDYDVNYPSLKNDYTVYDVKYPATYQGYKYRVLLNGYQVYPSDGWDTSISQKHTIAQDGYGVGDLKKIQEPQTVSNISVEKMDKISLVITQVDSTGVHKCDDVKFDAVFNVDTSATTNYKKIVSYLDTFNYMEENLADNILSYYTYDYTKDLYGGVDRQLMEQVDYASGAFCTSLFGESAKINFNSFAPNKEYDAALVFKADRKGNLKITSTNNFRGNDIAIWEYFDALALNNLEGLENVDGFRLRIEKNNKRIWPTESAWQEYKPTQENKGIFSFDDLQIGVNKDDKIAIRFNCGESENTLMDNINFTPTFIIEPTDTPIDDPDVSLDPDNNGGGGKDDGEKDKPINKGGCGKKTTSALAVIGFACVGFFIKRKTT